MRPIFLLLLLVLFGCQNDTPTEAATAEPVKKAIFIIVDGIPADVLERVSTPTLDEIAQVGGYTQAYVGGELGQYNQTPTISAPGYMDLLTGTWANKHNVWDNYNQAPNYNYWNIFRIAEAAKPELQTAIFSTWLDNRTILVGEGKPGAGDFKIDQAVDGFEVDTLTYPHDTLAQYIANIDEHVVESASKVILEQGPDLSWVYLEYTDDIGHRYGDGTEMDAAVKNADLQIKKIWEAIKQRQQQGEDWMIVITTDHGRDSISGRDHGDQSARERLTWMVTNAKDLNQRFRNGNLPITDITPSLLQHLGISPPEKTVYEMDGTSFVGKVSVDQFRAKLTDFQLALSWQVIEPTGNAEILVTFSNNFKTGGEDSYEKLADVPVMAGKANITLSAEQLALFEKSGMMKIVLKAPENVVNCWVVI